MFDDDRSVIRNGWPTENANISKRRRRKVDKKKMGKNADRLVVCACVLCGGVAVWRVLAIGPPWAMKRKEECLIMKRLPPSTVDQHHFHSGRLMIFFFCTRIVNAACRWRTHTHTQHRMQLTSNEKIMHFVFVYILNCSK